LTSPPTGVGSIRADVSKRPFALVAGLAILAAACSTVPTASGIDYGSGTRFVQTVADTLDNVGLASAVSVDSGGLPFITSFGFPGVVLPSQIPIQRPIGSPFLPAVLLATVDDSGVWTHGAIEQNKPAVTPNGISVPFGPVTTENFGSSLKEDTSNGTAVAVGADGTVHAAWTLSDGVYYGTTKAGGSATVTKVYDYMTKVAVAGPISAPGIALDADGNPWIAFSVFGPRGLEVHAAMLQGAAWKDQVVATEGACDTCPVPGPTGMAFLRGNPVVVFGDAVRHEVDAATLKGSKWVVDAVEANTDGLGLSVAAVSDTAYASYYTGHGTVDVATFDGQVPTTHEVGKAANPDPIDTGNDAARTAVVATKDGTIYVAWDNGDEGLDFASGTDTFAPIDIGPSAADAAHPALAASDAGVFLTWYDTLNQDLILGELGDVQNLIVANPQPSITPSFGPSGNAACGKDGKVVLDVTAQSLAFLPTCLVAPADKAFTITMDNKDTVQHDVSIYPSPDKLTPDDAVLYSFGDPNPAGPTTVTYPSDALPAGTYYFQCDFHPTTMNGTFAVVKGAS
jgi:plastocyanin